MSLELIKEAGKRGQSCLVGDRGTKRLLHASHVLPFHPPHSALTVVLRGTPAPAEMLPLHLRKAVSFSLFRFGLKCPSSEQPSLPTPLRQPLYVLWGTCQHWQSLAILVLVATAYLLDDMVLSFRALSPGRA